MGPDASVHNHNITQRPLPAKQTSGRAVLAPSLLSSSFSHSISATQIWNSASATKLRETGRPQDDGGTNLDFSASTKCFSPE